MKSLVISCMCDVHHLMHSLIEFSTSIVYIFIYISDRFLLALWIYVYW